MLALASGARPPAAKGPTGLVRLAADAGYEGVALLGDVHLGILRAAAGEALAAGLFFSCFEAPLPDGALPPGKRVPHLLAIDDKDEQTAAIRQIRRTFEAGRELGAAFAVLMPGPAPLRTSRAAFERAFARAEMDEDERGHKILSAAREERRAIGARLLDVARFGLERVAQEAERASLSIALPFFPTPWGFPSPREALLLLGELRGSPLGLLHAPARFAVAARLGLHGPPGRLDDLVAASNATWASDSVGLAHDLAPGLGVGPFGASPPPKVAPKAPVIVEARPDTRRAEAEAAASLARAAVAAATPAPS